MANDMRFFCLGICEFLFIDGNEYDSLSLETQTAVGNEVCPICGNDMIRQSGDDACREDNDITLWAETAWV